MKETDELEPQQYERRYWEDDVPLEDVRKNTLRKAVYVGAGLFVLIVIIGSLVKFPDEVNLPFVLRDQTPERIYRFPYAVYIEEQFQNPGSAVKKGDPLTSITSPEIVLLINNYKQAEASFHNYKRNKIHAIENTQSMVRLQAAQNSNRLHQLSEQMATTKSTWKSNEARLRLELEDANKRLEQSRTLYSSKHISAQELKSYEVAQARAADALTTAKETYLRDLNSLTDEAERFRLQNVSLSEEQSRNSFDANTDSVSLYNAMQIAREAIQHSFGDFDIKDGNLLLKAEHDGILSFSFTGEREVPASSILLKIQRSGKGIYALSVSPPTLIGKLKKGQTAYLKVATFPAYEWGTAKGHIDQMTLAPDENGVYNLRISIDEERQLSGKLKAGMTGNLAIQIDERTFFQYFFRNLKKMKYELEEQE